MRPSLREIPVSGPVEASLLAPPSKSVTQRALVLAALASGPSKLLAPLDAGDTRLLVRALGDLGIPVRMGEAAWVVEGRGGEIPVGSARLDAGDAGTTARFLTALVALGRGRFVVDGSERMRSRPIGDLVEALRRLGVDAGCLGERDCPPVEVRAEGLRGGTAPVRGARSSQYLSALLLVSPRASGRVELRAEAPVVSGPYVRLTVSVMREFGVAPEEPEPFHYVVEAPRDYPGREFRVEGDYSSAGYYFAAAAITRGRVRVGNLDPDSAQADRGLLEALAGMGCRVDREPDGWQVKGRELAGFDLDASEMPDAAPTLAVLALFARGTSRLRGLSTLRIKESDRVAALARELGRMGAEVGEGPDSLEIRPGRLRGAEVETYRDHRMAMSFALAGLRVPGVRILDPDCVAKSFPGFWDEFERLAGRAS